MNMLHKNPVILFIVLCSIYACNSYNNSTDLDSSVIEAIRQIASTEGFKPFEDNPVVDVGPPGSWDAGALGSMTVLKAGDLFHLYYESWGIRSSKEWDAAEYESLQIGHATSPDCILWTKDPANPTLPQGGEADFDRTGVWDPYVIYEEGLFKMWYGGGGGSQPNIGWAYATSTDGSHFEKKGLIGIGNQTGVEDCHVVHDMESGLYYMYYWYGWDEPDGLYLVKSPTEVGFDFNEAVNIEIEGDDSYMKKFGHVLRDKDGWHMFYSNFVQPHCPNSITRYAYSEDGVRWQAKNKRLLRGHDSEVLRVTDDLYLMFYSPQNHFDKKDSDIRLAVYHGCLADLASKPPFIPEEEPGSLVGKSLVVKIGEDPPLTLSFKTDGEVVLSEESDEEDPWTFNAYFIQDGKQVHIMGENMDMKGIFNGDALTITKY